MELEEQIAQMAEQCLDDPLLYIVAVKVTGKQQKNVHVVLGGDEGVTIAQCAVLSRRLGEQLEPGELFDCPYVLDVSSPGVGEPIVLPRQYTANTGRVFEIELAGGQKLSGTLMAATDNTLTIVPQPEKGKKKKKEEPVPTEIRISDIAKAVTVPVF